MVVYHVYKVTIVEDVYIQKDAAFVKTHIILLLHRYLCLPVKRLIFGNYKTDK